MHALIFEPSLKHPIDKALECNLLLASVVCPPIEKCERFPVLHKAACPEKVFQPAINQWIAFHIEKHISTMFKRQSGEPAHSVVPIICEDFISRRSLGIRDPVSP